VKITTKQVVIDGKLWYEASCNDFPYLKEYADTEEEAEELLWEAIGEAMSYLDSWYEVGDDY